MTQIDNIFGCLLILSDLSPDLSSQIVCVSVSGLDCFTDASGTVKEDCGMHTGCMKKFDMKSK